MYMLKSEYYFNDTIGKSFSKTGIIPLNSMYKKMYSTLKSNIQENNPKLTITDTQVQSSIGSKKKQLKLLFIYLFCQKQVQMNIHEWNEYQVAFLTTIV